MPAGRPRKPTERKRDEGTLRARDEQTPLVIGGRERPVPALLTSEGELERFNAIVDELEAGGILDKADRGAIELAAIAEAAIIACNYAIAEEGMTVKDDLGRPMRHPACIERDGKMKELRQLYDRLGIGPSSRAGLASKGFKPSKGAAAKHIAGVGEAPVLRAVK